MSSMCDKELLHEKAFPISLDKAVKNALSQLACTRPTCATLCL